MFTKKGFLSATSWIGKLDPATEADHTVVLYRDVNGGIRHSAVNMGSNSYLSKFESTGGVKKHMRHEVPLEYFNSSIGDNMTFHKLKPALLNPGDAPTTYWAPQYSHTGCTSCSCKTSQGWFIVNLNYTSSPGTFGPFQWSVSGASIAMNANHYIYVNKPGGGGVGVTTNATYTYKSSNCTRAYTKYTFFNFPSCSSFGYSYSLSKMDVDISSDRKYVTLVLPESMTSAIEDVETIPLGSVTPREFAFQVYDLNGRVYENKIITSEAPLLELSEPLQKGVYIFKLVLDQDNAITEKISIE